MDEKTRKQVLKYDIEALRNNVERIDENIQEFKTQIERMESEKMRLFQMIAVLEARGD